MQNCFIIHTLLKRCVFLQKISYNSHIFKRILTRETHKKIGIYYFEIQLLCQLLILAISFGNLVGLLTSSLIVIYYNL